MSRIYIIIVFSLIISCNTNTDITNVKKYDVSNLLKTKITNIKVNNDTLEINLKDKSWNAFEDYKTIKSKVFINDNYSIIKNSKNLKLNFSEQIDTIISREFSKKELSQIHNDFVKNDFFKRNIYLVSNSFSYIEYWNFVGVINIFSNKKYKKEIACSQFIENISIAQASSNKNDSEVKSLKIIHDYFKEMGMEDGWDAKHKRINAREFVAYLDIMLSFDLNYKQNTITIFEHSKNIIKAIKQKDTLTIKNEFYSYAYYDDLMTDKFILACSDIIKNLEIKNEDTFVISEQTINYSNKYLPKDTFETTSVLIPFKGSSLKADHINLSFMYINDERVLVGLSLFEPKK